MRIGIVPCLNSSLGGVYQYSVTMLHALNAWDPGEHRDQLVLFTESEHPALAEFPPPRWSLKSLSPPSVLERRRRLNVLRRMIGDGPHREAWRWLKRRVKPAGLKDPDRVRFQPQMNRWFRECGVEFVIYPVPTPLSFESGIPYVMAIHDLQHRLQPEFPEVSSDGESESREYYFRNGARRATLLLADSEVGKEDILTFYGPYGVTADRVKVLPFLPASYLGADVPLRERQRVRTAYRLPERYIFYPAQFWPHKNHINIIRALGLLRREQHLTIPVVFCGWHSGAIRERVFHDVVALATQLGVREAVHYLGFVGDNDMSAIYAEAAALVMPTYFGPTNIPVLEAWAYGCPVLTSDIRGIREHVGDAAILADPRSAESIAHGIYRIWTDDSVRAVLIERGRRRLGAYTPEHYRRRLRDILEEAKARVSSETSATQNRPG